MKKVLVVILVLFILAGLGAGGYFGITKVVKPMLDEKDVQDEEQVNALGDLLDQGSNETESMTDYTENALIEESKPMSVPTTDLPLSDDASFDECMEYLKTLQGDGPYDVFNKMEREIRLLDEYDAAEHCEAGDIELIAFSKEYVDMFSISNDEVLIKTIKFVFGSGASDKKLQIVRSVINRYDTTDIKQQFEYFGIQNGEVIAYSLNNINNLFIGYADKDFDSGLAWHEGYPIYPLAEITSDGDVTDFTPYIQDIVPNIKALISRCESESRFRLYRTLTSAFVEFVDYEYGLPVDFESDLSDSSSDGDILNEETAAEQETSESKSIGETLEESGQL